MIQETNVKNYDMEHFSEKPENMVFVSETQKKAWELIRVAKMVPAFAAYLRETRPTISRSSPYAAFNRFPHKKPVVLSWIREQAVVFATQNNLLHEPGA